VSNSQRLAALTVPVSDAMPFARICRPTLNPPLADNGENGFDLLVR
jgi:hypothetical protein